MNSGADSTRIHSTHRAKLRLAGQLSTDVLRSVIQSVGAGNWTLQSLRAASKTNQLNTQKHRRNVG